MPVFNSEVADEHKEPTLAFTLLAPHAVVVTTILAIWLGLLMKAAREQRLSSEVIAANHGTVFFDNQFAKPTGWSGYLRSRLAEFFGQHMVYSVVGVRYAYDESFDPDEFGTLLDAMDRLPHLTHVQVCPDSWIARNGFGDLPLSRPSGITNASTEQLLQRLPSVSELFLIGSTIDNDLTQRIIDDQQFSSLHIIRTYPYGDEPIKPVSDGRITKRFHRVGENFSVPKWRTVL